VEFTFSLKLKKRSTDHISFISSILVIFVAVYLVALPYNLFLV